MDNLPQVDQLIDTVKNFDPSQYVQKEFITAMALYGAYKVGYECLFVPTNGFWKHFLQPRQNLVKRYDQASWVLVTGATDGIGEALCHQFAKSGFNVVLVSRTMSKLNKVAGEVKKKFGVETVVIEYDFTNLKTSADAANLSDLITSKTKGLDVGILANNVGIISYGPYHNTQFEKMFNTFSVNIAAQSVMTHIFTNKWVQERKGKRCLIIDYSSVVALKPQPGVPIYSAEKSYNAVFSEALGKQYAAAYQADPVNMPNIEFMQVYPNSVKSALNPGRLLFSVTSEEHAKSVVDQIGWTSATRGAFAHCLSQYVRRFTIIDWLCSIENDRRMKAGRSAATAKESKDKGPKKFEWKAKEHASGQYTAELIQTAKDICAPGKGILAADESTGTIGKRFDDIKVENNHDNRRAYRELLFTAPGISEYISGVIMFDETVRDHSSKGIKFTKILKDRGIHCGIKVDTGLVPIAGTDDETLTQGLDGLGKRCAEYYKLGCRFAKWRAVLKIGKNLPSKAAIEENAKQLARYGSICQQNGLVPIIEPEILQDGDHDIEVCAQVSEKVFSCVMRELFNQNLLIEGLLLKPNMVTPGISCKQRATSKQIAEYTVRTLSRSIVPALPGVVFLSGGQSEEDATLNLHAMNVIKSMPRPWKLTFSYGRALQQSCLKAWQGKKENVKQAQWALLERAHANGMASIGRYENGIKFVRKLFVGGNWKCNGDTKFAQDFTTNTLNKITHSQECVDVIVSPTNLHMTTVKDILQAGIQCATQNISLTGPGAYTGELSADQVADLGIKYTLIGHSERRKLFNETDEDTAKKCAQAIKAGLKIVLCIGETLEEREAGKTDQINAKQLTACLSVITNWANVVVAYEPVWAIGTGKTATPQIAQEAHQAIRMWLTEQLGERVAEETRIIYGGSVNEKNAKELIEQEDVDGFLIGGASLKEDFSKIITTCQDHYKAATKDNLGGGESLFVADYKY